MAPTSFLRGMSREELRDGFVQVMQACYSADAYFQRLDAQFFDENFKFAVHHLAYWKSHRWAWAKRCFLNYCRFPVVAFRLLRSVDDGDFEPRYRRQLTQGPFCPLTRAAHFVHLCAQDCDALSLCSPYARLGGGRDRESECGAFVLPRASPKSVRVCGGCVALLLSTMGLMERPAGRPLLALSGH